eukprot:921992-Rhodomonas_salina.1
MSTSHYPGGSRQPCYHTRSGVTATVERDSTILEAAALGQAQQGAVMNSPELVATGDAERDAWLGAEEGHVKTQAQEYIYSTLVLAIVDALPEIVGKVDENSEEC